MVAPTRRSIRLGTFVDVNDVESAWLGWAWTIVAATSSTHLVACQSAGGEQDRADRLSPGFVGASYRQGGVLVTSLANGPGPITDSLARLRSIIAEWVEHRSGDQLAADIRFLDSWRRWFPIDQDSNPWWQRRVGWFVHDYAGLGRDELAVANLAPCRMVEQGLGERLARLCQDTHPFSRLLDGLRPSVIVCPSVAAGRFTASLTDAVVVAWDGRTFLRDGRRRADWANEAASQIRGRVGRAWGSREPGSGGIVQPAR